MYFALLWKNYLISLEELQLLKLEWLKRIDWNFVIFNTQNIEQIKNLWWIIKRWKYISLQNLWPELDWYNLIWTNSNQLWSYIKKTYFIKRFKQFDVTKTDLDIKNEWKEIILFWNELDDSTKIWVVMWYQNIWIYEIIDYEKKVRSMSIWMMPAKLTAILINIWLNEYKNNYWNKDSYTIFDTFCWTWTTMMVANYFNTNFIWSDINITPCKANLKWWESTSFFNKENRITLFKHDMNNAFSKNFLQYVDIIVSEWWLWPIVSQNINKKDLEKNLAQISALYDNFLANCSNYFKNTVLVLTLPIYTDYEDYWISYFQNKFPKLKTRFVQEIYKRKWQNVWRQIVIINF